MTVNIFGLYPSIYRELQRIHNGILFFLQTLGLFGILGFWLIVSLPLFFVNNKAADSLSLAESTSRLTILQYSQTQKIGTHFSASADFVTLPCALIFGVSLA